MDVMMELSMAYQVAASAHLNQIDRSGEPYIKHPVRVASKFGPGQESEQIVALLHDVVEDSEITLDVLRNHFGFSPETVAAVDAITMRKGKESYSEYMTRVKANDLAKRVKMQDMLDNLLNRSEGLTPENCSKYMKGFAKLTE